jgi:hypothetical protein
VLRLVTNLLPSSSSLPKNSDKREVKVLNMQELHARLLTFLALHQRLVTGVTCS